MVADCAGQLLAWLLTTDYINLSLACGNIMRVCRW